MAELSSVIRCKSHDLVMCQWSQSVIMDRDRETDRQRPVTYITTLSIATIISREQRRWKINKMWVWSVDWMTLTWDEVLSHCHSATSSANPIRIRPGLKSGLWGHKSATKCIAISFQISVSPQKICKCYHLRISQQLDPTPSHINPVNTLPEFSVLTFLSLLCLDLPCSIFI
jgi:hypothetical protein